MKQLFDRIYPLPIKAIFTVSLFAFMTLFCNNMIAQKGRIQTDTATKVVNEDGDLTMTKNGANTWTVNFKGEIFECTESHKDINSVHLVKTGSTFAINLWLYTISVAHNGTRYNYKIGTATAEPIGSGTNTSTNTSTSTGIGNVVNTSYTEPQTSTVSGDKQEVKNQIMSSLSNKLNAFSISSIEESEDDGNVVYTGKASIAEVPGFDFSATLKNVSSDSNKPGIKELIFTFPNNLNAAASILDKLLNTQIASAIPAGLPTPSLQEIKAEFSDDGITPVALAATLGCGDEDWDVLNVEHFAINGITLSLAAEDLNEPKPKYTIGLGGEATLDKLEMGIEGSFSSTTDGTEVELTGTVKNVSIPNILRGFGGPSNANVNSIVGSMPDPLKNLEINELAVSISPTDPSVSVFMETTFGFLEVIAKTENSQVSMSVGLQTPDIDKIEKWIGLQAGSLAPIKGLKVAAFLSTSDGKLKTAIPALKSKEDYNLIQGLNLVGIYDLSEVSEEDNYMGVKSVSMEAQIPSNPMDMVLRASLNTNLEIANAVYFDNVFVEIKPSPTDLYTSFGGNMGILLNDDQNTKLNFNGQLKLYPIETQACGELLFTPLKDNDDKVWRNPFGMPGIGIGEMGLAPCVSTIIPWITQLSATGNLELGSIPGKALKGGCAFSIDAINPADLVLEAYMSDISIAGFVEAFVDTENNPAFNGVKDFIKGFSQEHIGSEATQTTEEVLDGLTKSGVKDVRIKLATNTKTFLGKTYKRGIAFKGKSNLFGFGAEVDVELEPESLRFKIFGTLDPIDIKGPNNLTLFKLKGYDQPRAKLDIDFQPTDSPSAEVNGEVTFLGLTSRTKILLNSETLQFSQEGNLFSDALGAKFHVIASNYTDLNNANFHVSGNFTNNLQTRLADEVFNFMKASSKTNRQNLANARNGNNDLGAIIANTILDGVGTVEKGLYIAGEAILQGGLKEGLNIKSINFEGNVNKQSGKVNADVNLLVLGNPIIANVDIDLNTQDIGKLAEQIANDVIRELGNVPSNILMGLNGFFQDLFKAYQIPTCPPGRNCITLKCAGAFATDFYVNDTKYATVPAEQYRQYVIPIGQQKIEVSGYVAVTHQKIFRKIYNEPINATFITSGTIIPIGNAGPRLLENELNFKTVHPEIVQRSSQIEPIWNSQDKGICIVLENKSQEMVDFHLHYIGVDGHLNIKTIPQILPGHFRKIIFTSNTIEVLVIGGKKSLSYKMLKGEGYGNNVKIALNDNEHLTTSPVWDGKTRDAASCTNNNFESMLLKRNFKVLNYQNGWHGGSFTKASNGNLIWTNDAGVSWEVKPIYNQGYLDATVGANPYKNTDLTKKFMLLVDKDCQLTGFKFGNDTYSISNLALNKPTRQSSDFRPESNSGNAVDGNTADRHSGALFTTTNNDDKAWWEVDLGQNYDINEIKIYNVTDEFKVRLKNLNIKVSKTKFNSNNDGAFFAKDVYPDPVGTYQGTAEGRYVRVYISRKDYLNICEVQVFGNPK